MRFAAGAARSRSPPLDELRQRIDHIRGQAERTPEQIEPAGPGKLGSPWRSVQAGCAKLTTPRELAAPGTADDLRNAIRIYRNAFIAPRHRERAGQPADARRAALHAAGLRPGAAEPQRADAGRARPCWRWCCSRSRACSTCCARAAAAHRPRRSTSGSSAARLRRRRAAAAAAAAAGDGLQPMRDLDHVRAFLSEHRRRPRCSICPGCRSTSAICFLFHPWIGIAVLVGAIMLCRAHVAHRMADARADARRAAASRRRAARARRGRAPQRRGDPALGMRGRMAERWGEVERATI